MDDIHDIILTNTREQRCSNDEVAEYKGMSWYCLKEFDFVFLMLESWKSSLLEDMLYRRQTVLLPAAREQSGCA
jgi:hypothetical protein